MLAGIKYEINSEKEQVDIQISDVKDKVGLFESNVMFSLFTNLILALSVVSSFHVNAQSYY